MNKLFLKDLINVWCRTLSLSNLTSHLGTVEIKVMR